MTFEFVYQHPPPACIRPSDVDCGNPGVPVNGNVWAGSTSLGSIVKYKCDPSFQLVGESYRVCQISGLWSGVLPICEREYTSTVRLAMLRSILLCDK